MIGFVGACVTLALEGFRLGFDFVLFGRVAPLLLEQVGWRALPQAAPRRLGGLRHGELDPLRDRKSTRLNSSHSQISYAVFCLKKKKKNRSKDSKEKSYQRQLQRTPSSREHGLYLSSWN